MKILITGASGQLGKTLIENAPKGIEILSPSSEILDLNNQSNCLEYVKNNNPNWIINCGAYTNVEKAEKEKKLAFSINSEAPFTFAKALKINGGNLIHISSDYVFDGQINFPYPPSFKTSPISTYGKSKELGEKKILEYKKIKNKFFILRTSWLISKYGNNFLSKMLYLHKSKDFINVVSDQFGCTTSCHSLSYICWQLIQKEESENHEGLRSPEILHWCDSGITSWFDVAIAIGEIGKELGLLKKQAEVIPTITSEYKTLAKRPSFSLLNCKSTFNLLSVKQTYWRKSIYKILKEIKNQN